MLVVELPCAASWHALRLDRPSRCYNRQYDSRILYSAVNS